MKARLLWLLGGLFVFLQVCAGTAFAYNVTGTIQNNSGVTAKTVYVVLMDSTNNSTGFGTTLTNITAGSTTFTIHGVPNGQYEVAAFLDRDNTGSLHINDPVAASVSFTVASADQPAGTLTLAAVGSPQAPSAMNGFNVVTCDNGALVVWNGPKSQIGGNGPSAEIADSYTVYWGTSQNPGNGSTAMGSRDLPAAGGNYHVFTGNITKGTVLYFTVKSTNAAGTAFNYAGPYTIAAPTGAATVTGTVYSPGITKTSSTPLYIALQGNNGGFYIGEAGTPTDAQSWTITGVQPDTYSVYAILDMNDDGFSKESGYITGPGVGGGNEVAPFITVPSASGTVTAPDVTLKANNSITAVTTQNFQNSNYNLQFHVSCGTKQPVSATVNSGPNISGAIDLGLSLDSDNAARFGNNGPQVNLSGTKPSVGDTYSVTVKYSDGSSEILSPKVTGVITDYPTLIYPQGNTSPITTNTSLFAWKTPATLPGGYYDYSIWLNDNSGQVWSPQDQGSNMPSTQLSVSYNSDGSASIPTLSAGTTYNWSINVNDAFGNQGMTSASFTPQSGGPSVDGFSPATGAAGQSVVITGSGFTGVNAVSFGGIPASYTFNSDTQITATVPANAPVGPITVTVNGVSGSATGASSTPFQATTTYMGLVKDSSGNAVSGAEVTIVDSNPMVSVLSGSLGIFNVTVPSGVPVSFKISASGKNDIYTSSMALTKATDSTATPYTLVTDSDIISLGFSVASKGIISTKVRDWDSGNAIQGATVTATSFLHPDTPYTVYYSNPAGSGLPVSTGSTYTDGKFYVPNADEGDIVTVTASLNGYASQARTYVTHIGAVSENKVQVTPLPVVTASPAGGSITQAQTISLAVSSPITGDSYVIFYTTDGSDPTTSYSRQTYSGAFSLNSGNVTLKFFAVNTTHSVSGNVSTASYSVSTAPGAPTNVSAVAGNAQATISFSPPASNGGSTITGYTVTSNPGNITATGSASPITVTGLTNGTPYTFTVTATNAAGTGPASAASNSVTPSLPSYQLSVTVNGTGSGQVTSTPTGIICPAGNCSASFQAGTTVTLSQSASNGSQFSGWSGLFCSGNGTCSNSLNSAQSVTATFNVDPYIQIMGAAGTFYGLLQQAYNAAVSGSVIQAQAVTLDTDSLTMGNSTNVTIKGGLDNTFTNQTGYTTLQGILTIAQGSLVVDHLAIK